MGTHRGQAFDSRSRYSRAHRDCRLPPLGSGKRRESRWTPADARAGETGCWPTDEVASDGLRCYRTPVALVEMDRIIPDFDRRREGKRPPSDGVGSEDRPRLAMYCRIEPIAPTLTEDQSGLSCLHGISNCHSFRTRLQPRYCD